MSYVYWIIDGLWLLWAAYWIVSARHTKQSTQTETTPSRLTHLALLAIAFALLIFPAFSIGFLGWSLFPDHSIALVIGTVLVALGLGFATWARVHLGQYWSGTIDVKSGHRVISSGPYALVRHPIYTGFVLAFVGTVLAVDRVSGLLALALVILAYVRKIRVEETWLVRQLGEEYRGYQHRVRRLIPFLW